MYKIEKKKAGYVLVFGGKIFKEEMQKWRDESVQILLSESRASFGVVVDMRNLEPLGKETQEIMVDGQGLYKKKGMYRSAVILKSAIVTLQFKKMAIESEIHATERYIDATAASNAIEVAIKWVKDGI